ncbi:MAG: ABC transporter ATP-binding protein [Methanobacteriota archaeon]
MLKTNRLRKVFGNVVAVDDLTFEVRKGEIFGMLGTNGAGKTTTMKIFACLLKPTGGTAFVDGLDVTAKPLEVKSRLGYLPEMPSLFEKLTGREFLSMLGTLHQLENEALNRSVEKFSRELELGAALDMEIGTYSKGMRQRVAFASALLHEPPVLILDEPTSGLDPRFAKMVKRWIREYAERGGTVLMSTHVTEIAESLCDRVAIVSRGRIVGEGKPRELCAKLGVENLEDAFVRLVEAGS